MFLSKSYRQLEAIQERQCTYNATLRHVCATIFAVEKQLVLDIMNVCLYSCLSHTACKMNAPYYSLVRGQSGCTIFIYNKQRCSVKHNIHLINIFTDLWLHVSIH